MKPEKRSKIITSGKLTNIIDKTKYKTTTRMEIYTE